MRPIVPGQMEDDKVHIGNANASNIVKYAPGLVLFCTNVFLPLNWVPLLKMVCLGTLGRMPEVVVVCPCSPSPLAHIPT